MTDHSPTESTPRMPGYVGPIVIISRMDTGAWRYLWWDDATAYVSGDAPTVRDYAPVLQGVLPKLLSDAARTGYIRDDNTFDVGDGF